MNVVRTAAERDSGERALLRLEPAAVDIWLAKPEFQLEPRFKRILCEQERAELDRLVFANKRAEYLAAHVLLRAVLSAYVSVLPSKWMFVRGVNGRPEVAAVDATWLRFNLSHTTDLVAVAIALYDDVGVDVEHVCGSTAPIEVADHYFAASELEDLRALPDVEQHSAFFDYWTLKEAYIKALGLGLSAPLHRFAFRLRPDERPHLTAGLDGHPQQWHFELCSPTACHRLAVAVRSALPPRIRVRHLAWSELCADGVISR